jgi:CTP:molybdopterin cytidylyltransferase MocA
MGGPKALLSWHGRPLVEHGVRTLIEGGCGPVLVVLGAEAERVRQESRLDPAAVVVAEEWQEGIGASLRAGLAALGTDVDAVVIALVDQPLVTATTVARLVAAHVDGADAAVATYAGRPRNPVLLGRVHWAAAGATALGEVGARAWLRAHRDLVTAVACDDAGAPDDLDTPADLARLGGRERGESGADVAQLLATSILRQTPALADELVRRIGAENPGYRPDGRVPYDDLWQSCHDNLARVLQLVQDPVSGALVPSEDGGTDLFDAARTTGRQRAEQRVPLDDVLRSFRLGGRLVWEALIDRARTVGTAAEDALLDVGTRVWEVVDAVSAQVAIAYHDAERRLVRADEQRRAALWEGLLGGRASDAAFADDAARILDVPVRGPYAVVVGDNADAAAGSSALLESRLRAVGIRSAWQPRGEVLVGLVLAGPDVTPLLRELRDALPVPAGVSFVVPGLADVDAGYRQALLARRALPAGEVAVTSLAERLPEALLLQSPELTEELVRRWLGPLLDLPDAEGRLLLDTLEAWVVTAGSAARTATAVHCHRNTVINRLRRIETLTGHVASTATPLDLALALRAWRLLRADA